jgi:pentatricopeptide repeat protein
VFNSFINLLLLQPRGEGTALALSLFEYLASSENPYHLDIVTINTVLRHHAGLKDTKAMLNILERLPSMGDPKSPLKPDVITYTTVIDGLLSAENRKLANHLLGNMQDAGIQPSMHTYSLLIADLANTGMRHHLLAAEQMITSMTEAGMKPNEVTWTSLVGGYFKGGYTTDAWSTLARMRVLKVPFNRVTFNMILRWCAGSASVQMEGPILRYINTALRMSSKPQRKTDQSRGQNLCLDILDAMQAAHIRPNEDSWFLALDGLMRARKWNEAFAVSEEMKRKRFDVKPGSSLHAVVERARRVGDR